MEGERAEMTHQIASAPDVARCGPSWHRRRTWRTLDAVTMLQRRSTGDIPVIRQSSHRRPIGRRSLGAQIARDR